MSLKQRDNAAIWHPYTQHQITPLPMPISRAQGAYLYDEQGNAYLDLISSWFVNLHGHCHPDIAAAIYEQAQVLEHVIFSGFTHEPAVRLAEKLLACLPNTFTKIFYSDNGSTAVEVAIKMAYQYWRNQGEMQRKRFIVFEGSYHGDTFGAMSLGKGCGWFSHFNDLLFDVDLMPFPVTWMRDADVEKKEKAALEKIAEHLTLYGHETAAVVIEPLVQGSGGMRMCTPRFLKQLSQLVQSHSILMIYDEAMTGFGRTGGDFACITAETVPDIICFAKGITGGFLPLAATACHEKIYQAFLGDTVIGKALIHGHSYTANPLGCVAGLASLALLHSAQTQAQIQMIEKTHQRFLNEFCDFENIQKPRYCGTIAAFNLEQLGHYGSQASIRLRDHFLAKGLLVRPFGDVFYLFPPYCVTEAELTRVYDIIIHETQGVKA